MKKPINPTPQLRELAYAQSGVLSVGQAEQLGLSRNSVARLVRSRRWRRIGPSLLFVHDHEPAWLALAWAGVIYAGPDARVGGQAAAHLHELSDHPPDEITILIPHQRRLRPRPPWVFQRERPGVRSDRSPGDPPRLTVEDTVLDLCVDRESAVHWVTAVMQRRRTTPSRLRTAIMDRRHVPNRRFLVDLLADTRRGAESPLEVQYLRDVERGHGLPHGRRQIRRTLFGDRHDVGYEEFALIVELDGRLGHDGMGKFRDYRRDNAAATGGLLTLRYGWADVAGNPCGVARQVAEVLIQRGWAGLPSRCSRCTRLGENDIA